jgi:hypothetical protein
MASESLNSFLEVFDQKIDLNLSKYEKNLEKKSAEVDEYKSLYEQALNEAIQLGEEETFKSIFPEDGGSNINIFATSVDPRYVSMIETYESDIKRLEQISDSEDRLSRIQSGIDRLNEIKAKGGEEYLNNLRSNVVSSILERISASNTPLDSVLSKLFEDPDEYSDFVEFYVELDGPTGVKSSPEAFYALKEIYDSGSFMESSESEESESPINEEEISEESAVAEEAESPINEELETEEDFTQDQSNILTEAPEIGEELSAEEPTADININLETGPGTTEEITEPEVETEPEKSPELSEEDRNKLINYYESVGMPIPDYLLIEPEQGTTFNQTSINQTESGATENNSEINNVNQTTVESDVINMSETVEPAAVELSQQPSVINQVQSMIEDSSQIFENINPAGALDGALNELNSNVFDSTNIEQSLSNLTEGDSKMFNISEIVENPIKAIGNIFSKKDKTESSETVERSETRLKSEASPNVSNISETSSSTQEVSNIDQSSNVTNSEVSETVSKPTESNVQNNMDESKSSTSSSSSTQIIDNSEVVSRLKRLERLLSGPLEVKIVE